MATTIERAFELARSGGCDSLTELRKKLKDEHCENIDGYLSGSVIKQLRALIRTSRNLGKMAE